MLNQVTILGEVTEVLDDRDAILVVVRTGGGRKKDGGTWEELAACRFWGDAKKYVEGVGMGQLVKIDASAKSRAGNKGGYFSNIEARYLQRLSDKATSGAKHTRTTASAQAPSESSDDDNTVPF